MRKRTNEEFIRLLKIRNSKVKHLEQYQTNKTEILVKCLICNNEWKTTPERLLAKYGCPKCGHQKNKQAIYNKTKQKIFNILKNNFIMTPEYNGDKLYEFTCLKCGRIQKLKAQSVIKSGKLECCCSSNKPNHYDQKSFIEKANEIHNNKYDYSKLVYLNSNKVGTIICPIHGEFNQMLKRHLKGQGCPKCAIDNRKSSTKEFIEKSNKIHINYDYSKVEYINNSTKVCIICPIHGEFFQTPQKHLQGQGCPSCKKSKGEEKIELYLKNQNINYIPQYDIDIDTSINVSGKAQIDFYLPDYNIAIEYNGKQHYVPVEKFGGEIAFEKQKKRDEFVRNYCKKNNIKLIEIKYTNKNINKILDDLFK